MHLQNYDNIFIYSFTPEKNVFFRSFTFTVEKKKSILVSESRRERYTQYSTVQRFVVVVQENVVEQNILCAIA